jgi:hypothetical protein
MVGDAATAARDRHARITVFDGSAGCACRHEKAIHADWDDFSAIHSGMKVL